MNTKLQLFFKNQYFKKQLNFLGAFILLCQASLYANENLTTLNLQVENAALTEVFSAIEKQTHYTFVFDEHVKKYPQRFTVDFKNKELQSVLDYISLKTGFSVQVINQNITVAAPQKYTLTGKITDKEGVPLPGASIIQKGTNLGTSTDFDGKFYLKVNQLPTTVVVTFLGFTPKEISVTKLNLGTIILEESTNALDEVVVTALGIKREEKKLGYAQQTVTSEELMEARPNNWSEALKGKVPGLTINGVGGPISSQQIVLRGNSSLDPSNNGALIVIDGIPIQNEFSGSGATNGYMGGSGNNDTPIDFGNAISDLNPEDIESISVLKGASAAALYGYQSANGAIIITTKSGNKKKGLGVTVSSNTKFDVITRWPDWQYEYGQGSGKGGYLKPATDANGNPVAYNDRLFYSYGASEDGNSTKGSSSAFGPKFDGQYYFQYDPELEGQGAERTLWRPYKDNRKDFWRTGITQTQNITLDGGSEKGSIRSSITHTKNEWVMPNTGYEQLSLSVNASHQISDKMKLSSIVNYRNRTSDNLPGQGYNNHSIGYFMIFQNPNVDLDWYKPIWRKGEENIDMIRPYSSYIDNPYAIAYEIQNSLDQNAITGNVKLDYEIVPNLTLMARGALNMYNKAMDQERPYDVNRYARGYYRTTKVLKKETNLDVLLTYKNTFGNLELEANVGGNRMDYEYRRQDSWAEGLEIPGQYMLSNGTSLLTSEYNGFNKVNSVYGLVSLGWKKMLFLDLTGRNDWNSVLPAHNRSYFFPSANASFILSEALEMPKAISFAKLRASVSEVGGAGAYGNRYKTQKYYGRSDFPGSVNAPTSLYNKDFKPEVTLNIEAGFDVRFFNNRLKLDAAVYQTNSKNQILKRPLAYSTGYSSAIINAGEVRNRGIELLVKATPIKTANFKWTTHLNWAKNEGKVLSLPESVENGLFEMLSSSGAKLMAVEGGSPAALYGRGFERNEAGEIIYNSKGTPQMTSEAIYIGDTQAKWTAGFSNTFTYKNFRMHVQIDGKYGGKIYSHTHHKLTQQGKLKHTLVGREAGELVGKGVVENADGTYSPNTKALPIATYYDAHYKLANTEANSFDASFVKLREVSLSYDFSKKTLERTFLNKLSLSLYGRNLAVLSDFPIYDPEVAGLAGGTSMHPGAEVGQLPVPTEFGLNVKFGF
ncbi:MAG: SusC/RagA family TonB-linked outer membrane protein [Mesonia hippocampi]|uniref:SusC/RagA family TonB-linked outer membrane protein n=1 Tax=Mesonia hippocampi TaxID=1628250 RepID=UPI003F96303A